jgi:hypothetical protein
VDAIFPSTFVVWLTLVPDDAIIEDHGPRTATPGPTSSAVPLGPPCPVVKVALPRAIFCQVAQTVQFRDAF